MTTPFARLAVAASLLALAALATLHVLRPDLSPPHHMISEYGVGPHGAGMTVCFLAFSLASLSLFVALLRHARGGLGRGGLGFLLLTAVGLALGGLFPMDMSTADPAAMSFSGKMHNVGFMVGVPSELLSVLLLSLALRRDPSWTRAPLGLWAAAVWVSLIVMVPLLMQLRFFGIPNRTFMIAFGIWIALAAWPLARTAPAPGRAPEMTPH